MGAPLHSEQTYWWTHGILYKLARLFRKPAAAAAATRPHRRRPVTIDTARQREERLSGLNEHYTELRMTPEALTKETEERNLWDHTIRDGIQPESNEQTTEAR